MENKLVLLIKAIFLRGRVTIVLIGSIAMICLITYVMYVQTQLILTERLRQHIQSIVATAANEFNIQDINAVKNESNISSWQFARLVHQLQNIKKANPDVTYAYIMRRLDAKNPEQLEFVADANSLDAPDLLDVDEDGVVSDEEKAPLPGEHFDATQYPELLKEAFIHPIAASKLESDQWSVQLSAYAPIFQEDGIASVTLGIDVVINDFNARTRAMLRPFVLFIVFLIIVLSLLTLTLMRVSNERVEAIREIDRQKDELLGIVSHQLATPITALKWDFEMLLDGDMGDVKPEQRNFFQKLQGVTAHLADLVSMILDVSRIQLGRMKVDRTSLDLNAFFDEVINIMEAKAKEKNVNLQFSIQKQMGAAMLDKRLMLMITENLLSNAIKYTPVGGDVTFEASSANGILHFSVRDTGCGIPLQDQGKIFGKLYRASNVRNVDGNGFGLYVVKGAVEVQDGQISFVSSENIGTTFDVKLPHLTS